MNAGPPLAAFAVGLTLSGHAHAEPNQAAPSPPPSDVVPAAPPPPPSEVGLPEMRSPRPPAPASEGLPEMGAPRGGASAPVRRAKKAEVPSASPTPAIVRGTLLPDGFSLSVGGGPMRFVYLDARSFLKAGGFWAIRANTQPHPKVGFELAHVGSLSGVYGHDSLSILGLGVEATVRFGWPLRAGPVVIEPYFFGGLGFSYFNVLGDGGGADSRPTRLGNSDLVAVIPSGIGLAAHRGRGFVSVRGTYRYTMDDNALVVVPAFGDGEDTFAPLDQIAIETSIGWAF